MLSLISMGGTAMPQEPSEIILGMKLHRFILI
jgi:hypothetical protein